VENHCASRQVNHRFDAVLESLNEHHYDQDRFKNTNEDDKVGNDFAFSIAHLAHDWHHHQEHHRCDKGKGYVARGFRNALVFIEV